MTISLHYNTEIREFNSIDTEEYRRKRQDSLQSQSKT